MHYLSEVQRKRIAKRIRMRRNALLIDVKQAAKTVGLGKAEYEKLERGEVEIKRGLLNQISDVLRTTPAWLLGR